MLGSKRNNFTHRNETQATKSSGVFRKNFRKEKKAAREASKKSAYQAAYQK